MLKLSVLVVLRCFLNDVYEPEMDGNMMWFMFVRCDGFLQVLSILFYCVHGYRRGFWDRSLLFG